LEVASVELANPVGVDVQFTAKAKQPRLIHLKQSFQKVGRLNIAMVLLFHCLQGPLQALLYVIGHGGVVHNERVSIWGIESRTPPNPTAFLYPTVARQIVSKTGRYQDILTPQPVFNRGLPSNKLGERWLNLPQKG